MDEIDAASASEQRGRDAGIAAIRRAARGGDGAGADECRECGERIPAARRRLLPGAELCVDCQAMGERRARL